MPRGNRYIVPGNIYHLTHRCHDREFLLKFARDRDGYRRRLREAVVEVDLSLPSYNITSNHVHLLAYADDAEQIAVDGAGRRGLNLIIPSDAGYLDAVFQ